jgi:hypothetical protein
MLQGVKVPWIHIHSDNTEQKVDQQDMRDLCDVLKGSEGDDSMKRIVAAASTDKLKEKEFVGANLCC